MNKKEKKSTRFVQSVQRAGLILEALAKKEPELGVAELSKETGLNQSTVHRLLRTLYNLNFVNQNSNNHKYRLDLKLFELGSSVVNKIDIIKLAIPYMKELSKKYNEAINLAKLDKDEIIYIHKIESSTTLKLDLKFGSRHPAYCTSLGKVFLAYLEENELISYLERVKLKKFTLTTITHQEKLKQELILIKEQGYAFDNEEYVQGVSCLAVPIRNHTNKVCAALSIAIPSIRFKDYERSSMINDLITKSKKISY